MSEIKPATNRVHIKTGKHIQAIYQDKKRNRLEIVFEDHKRYRVKYAHFVKWLNQNTREPDEGDEHAWRCPFCDSENVLIPEAGTSSDVACDCLDCGEVFYLRDGGPFS